MGWEFLNWVITLWNGFSFFPLQGGLYLFMWCQFRALKGVLAPFVKGALSIPRALAALLRVIGPNCVVPPHFSPFERRSPVRNHIIRVWGNLQEVFLLSRRVPCPLGVCSCEPLGGERPLDMSPGAQWRVEEQEGPAFICVLSSI